MESPANRTAHATPITAARIESVFQMRNGGFLRSAQQEVADEFDRLFER